MGYGVRTRDQGDLHDALEFGRRVFAGIPKVRGRMGAALGTRLGVGQKGDACSVNFLDGPVALAIAPGNDRLIPLSGAGGVRFRKVRGAGASQNERMGIGHDRTGPAGLPH
jgi:hypothetical protein